MGERDNKRRAVERLALRRMEHINKNGGRTTFEREHAEAAKVARHSDATESTDRRSMGGRKSERSEPDTSSRPGESKAAWLARMRSEKKG